ncbi:MAG: hypothetical protein COU31_00550 [Candidatus Magasanikbacteria bacterium CG10_big_fil_rev_8_21_14_0_10_40_10]|uniref:Uncharacterized protein n=1 Tax=Candidatus Magasanikbacteria bacterium CG10_big_fil_rev_8_21_14_0_10_40_10 TaxID=1974648 RepID=A0A2M6W525_9BACT|nr:MAG: hypothetical protein COU31_00550 [Candidatus Magasanikbacteria bacterium CG10_big_fil_rev_8_21_14_0_10_40_10]
MTQAPINNQLADDQLSDQEEQLKQVAIARGQKLGFLIAKANIPDEQKQAWMELAEHMDNEQLDRFVQALEAQFVVAQSPELDKKFEDDVRQAEDKYQARVNKAKDEALAEMAELEGMLDKAGKKD